MLINNATSPLSVVSKELQTRSSVNAMKTPLLSPVPCASGGGEHPLWCTS
jgi:hypothetical protein